MTVKDVVKGFLSWLTTFYRNQPDIKVIAVRRMPQVEPQPFRLEGHILQSDTTVRTISKGGSSVHVTIPPNMVPFLSDFQYCGRFEAWGKNGLIFLCAERGAT
jgi:hypothetical protein